ncbi:hypothetical protein HQ394_14145 [Defluviicoccus vanus]|uniref:Transposase n=1 Tax=Defluviicoccus vanus TaxID=111831 RepID=A0A7H1N3H4_9PROT|nr:hypothetical protein HQ394_14145 [Defluviicoccus vanus]
MTSKTTNKFSPEGRGRAVRMVLEHEGENALRWAAIASIATKIGCTPETLRRWVKTAEQDSGRIDGGKSLTPRCDTTPGDVIGCCFCRLKCLATVKSDRATGRG